MKRRSIGSWSSGLVMAAMLFSSCDKDDDNKDKSKTLTSKEASVEKATKPGKDSKQPEKKPVKKPDGTITPKVPATGDNKQPAVDDGQGSTPEDSEDDDADDLPGDNDTEGQDTATATATGTEEATSTASQTGTATSTSTETKTEERLSEEEAIFKNMPKGAAQLKVLCARPGQDKVRQVFCAPNPPSITSLVDLQKALGLGITDPTQIGRNRNGDNGNAAFTFTAGSSSLVGKFTSAINPRLIMFTPPTGNRNPSLVALGFLRGEQFVEVIAGDPSNNQLNFFLVRFEQACNGEKEGCSIGQLLTPSIEKNWTALTIYEDHDIQNTIVDCKQCHQPGGEGSPKMLRMQELRNPWTHFIRDNTNGGQALLADYNAARGTAEDLGGVPAAMISSSDPALLEQLVRQNGFAAQPNEFTPAIEREVRNANPNQPQDNATMGQSATWNALYDRFVKGEVIAPPFHDVKVTDPAKLASLSKAYQDYRAGAMAEKDLPDLRDVLNPAGLRNMGFMVKAGLTGPEILMNACAQCHNSLLPQNISRAKFNVDLSTMSRAEKDLAIARLKLPAEDPKRMPPARIRSLTKEEIELLTKELMK